MRKPVRLLRCKSAKPLRADTSDGLNKPFGQETETVYDKAGAVGDPHTSSLLPVPGATRSPARSSLPQDHESYAGCASLPKAAVPQDHQEPFSIKNLPGYVGAKKRFATPISVSSDAVPSAPSSKSLVSTSVHKKGTTDTNDFNIYGYTFHDIQQLNTIPLRRGLPMGDRLLRCSQNLVMGYLKAHCTNNAKPVVFRCDLKICPVCSKQRSNKLYDQYAPLVSTFKDPRFLTLTWKNTHEFDKKFLNRCHNNWRALKTWLTRPDKKGRVLCRIKKGIIVKETTWNADSGYHYHIHIIYDGDYINQADLTARWCKITKGSYIVDIRSLRSMTGGVKYLLKYVTKNDDITDINALTHFLNITKGQRRIQTFGAETPKKPQYDFVCKTCDTTLTSRELRDQIVTTKPDTHTITAIFPYYLIPRGAPVTKKPEITVTLPVALPHHFSNLQDLNLLDAIRVAGPKGIKYDTLASMAGKPIDNMIAYYKERGDIFQIKDNLIILE